MCRDSSLAYNAAFTPFPDVPVRRKPTSRETRSKRNSRRTNGNLAHASSRNGFNPNATTGLTLRLLEDLQEGVATLTSQGRINYANSRFAELLGANRSERVVGRYLKLFLSAASWLELETALARGSKLPTEGQLRVTSPDGLSSRTIHLSLAPIRHAGNTKIRIVASEVTELVKKDKALQDSEASLHSLSARILQLQDQERRRIARDLHDITGQELSVIVMSLSQLADKLDAPGLDARQAIVDAIGLVRKVEDEIRTLSYVFHPPLLDEFGLGSALHWYVEGFTKRSGIQVEIKSPRDLPRLSVEKETALFRVVQESLTNVLRHSGSRWARIHVSFDKHEVTLSVEDEGRGIDTKKNAERDAVPTDSGVGIAGMRERLQQLGGSLIIRPRSRGTQVVATLPIVQGESADSTSEAAVSRAVEEARIQPEGAKPDSCTKRVLIVDDHEVTRHGIKMLLRDQPGIEICGELEDGFQAVLKAKELNPDLIVMDLSLPRVSGYSAATSIRESGSQAKVLFFTTHSYPQLQRMSRLAGFEGLVEKTNGARDLLRGVRAVLDGHKFYNSEVIQEHAASAAASAR